jgi:hypothetical protein
MTMYFVSETALLSKILAVTINASFSSRSKLPMILQLSKFLLTQNFCQRVLYHPGLCGDPFVTVNNQQ